MSLYRKLFVVIDPTSKKQPALERSADIAAKSKGKVTVGARGHYGPEDSRLTRL
jgi:hypothetical protein